MAEINRMLGQDNTRVDPSYFEREQEPEYEWTADDIYSLLPLPDPWKLNPMNEDSYYNDFKEDPAGSYLNGLLGAAGLIGIPEAALFEYLDNARKMKALKKLWTTKPERVSKYIEDYPKFQPSDKLDEAVKAYKINDKSLYDIMLDSYADDVNRVIEYNSQLPKRFRGYTPEEWEALKLEGFKPYIPKK